MSIQCHFTDAHLCHEVHLGILHLPAAACPWWHPHVALGLFQWSHTPSCHISLVDAWDFSALLQPHSSLLNGGVKPQLAARSKKQRASAVPDGGHEFWGSSGSPGHELSHSPVLAEQMRVSGHLLWSLVDNVRSL